MTVVMSPPTGLSESSSIGKDLFAGATEFEYFKMSYNHHIGVANQKDQDYAVKIKFPCRITNNKLHMKSKIETIASEYGFPSVLYYIVIETYAYARKTVEGFNLPPPPSSSSSKKPSSVPPTESSSNLTDTSNVQVFNSSTMIGDNEFTAEDHVDASTW